MTDDTTGQDKIDRPHAFFKNPQQVVTEPSLSKDQKTEALDALEQDARQLAAASDEGMAGGDAGAADTGGTAADDEQIEVVGLAWHGITRLVLWPGFWVSHGQKESALGCGRGRPYGSSFSRAISSSISAADPGDGPS